MRKGRLLRLTHALLNQFEAVGTTRRSPRQRDKFDGPSDAPLRNQLHLLRNTAIYFGSIGPKGRNLGSG